MDTVQDKAPLPHLGASFPGHRSQATRATQAKLWDLSIPFFPLFFPSLPSPLTGYPLFPYTGALGAFKFPKFGQQLPIDHSFYKTTSVWPQKFHFQKKQISLRLPG